MKYFYYLCSSVLAAVLIRKYKEFSWGWCKNTVSLTGKVVLITGANCGIGFETAKEFAKRGAKVILACRDLEKAKEAIVKIQQSLTETCILIPMQLDLSSLTSIKIFIETLKRTESKIDILINNAGVSFPRNTDLKTQDNFEIHFGVNHLGHFYLTTALIPLLKEATPSRIIIVSSTLHEAGRIHLNNLNLVGVNKDNAYKNSKLANAYFAQILAQKIKNDHINVYCVCPGWVKSGLFRNYNVRWYHKLLVAPIAYLYMRSARQGCQTIIYCATEPRLDIETGLFYRNCTHYESKHKFDANVGRQLWFKSEEMVQSSISKLS